MFGENDVVVVIEDSEANASGVASETLRKVGRIARLYEPGNSYGFQVGVEIPALGEKYPEENVFGFCHSELRLLEVGDKVVMAKDEGLDVSHLGQTGIVKASSDDTFLVLFEDGQYEWVEYYHIDEVAS